MKNKPRPSIVAWFWALAWMLLFALPASAAPGKQVVVSLSEQPPSRIYCELKNDSEVVQVEFDPTVTSRLTRSITLPSGKWTLTCSAESKTQLVSLRDSVTAPVEVSWTFEPPPEKSDANVLHLGTQGSAKLKGFSHEIKLQKKEIKEVPRPIWVTAETHDLVKLADAKKALSVREGGKMGGRSLDSTAPPIVQDTLRILAEIALERARTRGYALMSQRITKLVCEELKATAPIPEIGITKDQILLPNTCDAVRNMNLHELAQAGAAVSAAVEKDILQIAFGSMTVQLQKNVRLSPSTAIVVALVKAVDSNELVKKGRLQPALVSKLLGVVNKNRSTWFTPSAPEKADLENCLVDTALLTAQGCLTDTRCGSEDLRTVVVESIKRATYKTEKGTDTSCSALIRDAEVDRALAVAQVAVKHGARILVISTLPDLISEALSTTSDLLVTINPAATGSSPPALYGHLAFLTEQAKLVLEPLLTNRKLNTREIQLALIRLAQHQWAAPVSPTLEQCALDVAFASVAACHGRDGGCDARAISDLLQHPGDYFDLDNCDGVLKSVSLDDWQWPEAAAFVARAIDVVAPPPGATARDQAKDGITLVFGVARRLTAGGSNSKIPKVLEHMEGMSLGLVDEDTRTALVESLALVRFVLDENKAREPAKTLLNVIDRVTPVITVLAANAKSLKEAAANPADAEALRKARKESIEALIDASTKRDARGGETVVSLGANVGFYAASNQGSNDSKKDNQARLTVGLPMGLAIQRLPISKDQVSNRCWLLPSHLQFSFVDLGQFIDAEAKKEDLQWNDFLMVGAQFGWIPNFFDSPSDAFVFGPDIRYIPGGSRKDSVFIGGFLSYYVPFFDLN